MEENSCTWELLPTDDEDVTKQYCSVCGTTYTETFIPKQEGCWWNNSRVHSYERDGEVLYSYTVAWSINVCENETTKVEYINGSCANGVIEYQKCINCGEESYETWLGDHPHVYREEIPVEGEGICYNHVIYAYCPCGQSSNLDYVTSCSIDYSDTYVSENVYEYKCQTCGLTRTETTSYSEKDEHCYGDQIRTYTYTDAQGAVLQEFSSSSYGEYHDLITTHELKPGSTSCTDGAIQTTVCQDCGLLVSSGEFASHWTYAVERFNTAQYGMCGDVLEIWECACGEQDNIQTQVERCDWQYRYTPETGMYYQCSTCNTIRTYERYLISTEGCKENWSHDIIYIQNDQEILRIQNPYVNRNHRQYFTFELHGKTCEDGYTVTEHCMDCNYENNWGEYSDNHNTWAVDRKFVSQGKLCGDLESVSYSCACGQEKTTQTQWYRGSCSYENDEYYIESLGAWVSKCTKCGYEQVRRETQEPGASRCETLITNTYTFRKNGVNMFSYVDRYIQNNHTYIFTLTLNGETCDDGYHALGVCYYCGSKSDWGEQYTGCGTVWTVNIETQQLGEESCGSVDIYTYSCACGRSGHIDFMGDCQWNWIDTTEESGQIYHCSHCGLYAYKKQVTQKKPNSCEVTVTDTLLIQRGDDVIYQYENTRNAYVHTEVTAFELLGETCQDGYVCTETCFYCGKVLSTREEYSDHCTYTTEIIDLTQYGLCQGYIAKRSCACTELVEWSLNDICSWECEICGITISASVDRNHDRENCREISTYSYAFVKDNQVVYNFIGDGWEPMHEVVASFQLHNEEYGCEGGYQVTMTCRNCDYAYTGSGSEHAVYEVEYLPFQDFNEAICDGTIVVRKCACGKYTDIMNSYSQCQASTYEYEEFEDEQGFWHYSYTYPCDICGMEKVEAWYDVVDQENCSQYQVHMNAYRYNGEVLYENMIKSGASEHHDYSNVVYTLLPGATSCDDGVLATATCHCGSVQENVHYGHTTETLEEIDLTQYGLCSGRLSHNVCVCGRVDRWDMDDSCWGCDTCGLSLHQDYAYRILDPDCKRQVLTTYRITDGEEVLFERTLETTEEFHVEVATFQLFDEAAGCDAGYQITSTCRKCGYSSTWESSGHNYYPVDYLFLDAQDADLCEGYIIKESCPCGKYQWFSNYPADCSFIPTECKEDTDSQGVHHNIWTYTCEHCGLEKVEDQFDLPDAENCLCTNYIKTSYRLNGVVLMDCLDVNHEYARHTYEDTTYSLLPGATSCNDGVLETATCKYCDEQTETTYYYHCDIPVETIDLQQYGAVCNTQFTKYQCPCGYSTYGRLVGDEMCDMQDYYTGSWIEGALEDEWQDNSEGDVYVDSEYWTSTCAVTDPQCAFKVRAARYYIQEGCEAVQYEIWQFGFNEATGECAYEFSFPTGKRETFHDYVSEYTDEQLDENTTVGIYTETCSICQSTYTTTYTYVDGHHYSTETVAVNTLDNGENKSRREYYVYGFRYDYTNYSTVNLYECTRADGSEFWYRYDYTYDLPDSCTRTCIYTDSDGGHTVTEEALHISEYERVILKENTCTQFGQAVDRWTCRVCGHIDENPIEVLLPTCHNWMPDPEAGMSICDVCGLQNANGATGSIAMEDLTESHGEGANYVVGYWNQDDLSVHKYVSVVLKDAEEGSDNELILDGISFTELNADTDGITAISFSQADAAAAAQAALEEAGYTGDYAIRFTFVPTETEDTLDYAITFDALSV